MKLAVGIITYNDISAKYLADFLPSLKTALAFLKPDDYQVYAFDNSAPGFTDNRNILYLPSYQFIKYISEGRNLGFGRAYNILIESALRDGAQYFLIINPDTILEPAAIRELVAALDNDGSLASVGPKILRWHFIGRSKTNIIDSCGLILKPGLRFSDLGQGQEDEGQFDRASILGPTGAAGLFRLSALKNISEHRGEHDQNQYFDEHFFMYKEDCDLAYRLFLAGYKSYLVATSLIYHDRTAAVSGQNLGRILGDRRRKSRLIRSWSFRNQHLLFVKHWSKQNLRSKLAIIYRILLMFIFSLILEQFLLKEYYFIFFPSRVLTDTK